MDDPEKLAEAERKARDQRDVELNCIREILTTYQGRQFLWNILSRCHVYKTSMSGRKHDVIFQEGERNIGLWLLNEVFTAMPNAYTLIRSEAMARDAVTQEVNSDG